MSFITVFIVASFGLSALAYFALFVVLFKRDRRLSFVYLGYGVVYSAISLLSVWHTGNTFVMVLAFVAAVAVFFYPVNVFKRRSSISR